MGKHFIQGHWYTELGKHIALNDCVQKMKEALNDYEEFHKPRELLGEKWDMAEIFDARHAMGSVYEGVSCSVPYERMLDLQKRGLVSDVTKLPGRGRYANRYTFEWNQKLEDLVKASKSVL
jgi:hypothetical protein